MHLTWILYSVTFTAAAAAAAATTTTTTTTILQFSRLCPRQPGCASTSNNKELNVHKTR